MAKIFDVHGFFQGKRVIPRMRIGFDGAKLDELHINTIATSQHDIEALIEFLKIQKHCFPRPEEPINQKQNSIV